jgi:hypothetical protein
MNKKCYGGGNWDMSYFSYEDGTLKIIHNGCGCRYTVRCDSCEEKIEYYCMKYESYIQERDILDNILSKLEELSNRIKKLEEK